MLSEAFRLMGLSGAPDPQRVAQLDLVERRIGRLLPATAREWYAAAGAEDWLLERCEDWFVGLDRLGEPHDMRLDGTWRLDYARHGFLLLATENQGCCRWVIPLAEPSRGADAAAESLPSPDWDRDDPPVFVTDLEDPACQARGLEAERFSDFMHVTVWDWHRPFEPEHRHWEPVRLRPEAVESLRRRMTALPTTHRMGKDRGRTVYRFTAPDARVALYTDGEVAYPLIVEAPDRALRDRLVAILKAAGYP